MPRVLQKTRSLVYSLLAIGYDALLFKLRGQLIGHIVFQRHVDLFEGREIEQGKSELHVFAFFVQEELNGESLRGRGLGTLMLGQFVGFAHSETNVVRIRISAGGQGDGTGRYDGANLMPLVELVEKLETDLEWQNELGVVPNNEFVGKGWFDLV